MPSLSAFRSTERGTSTSRRASLGWGNYDELDDPGFMASQAEQKRLMVKASINHPSVVINGFLNEFGSNLSKGRALADLLADTIRAEDSGHLVTYASSHPTDGICASNLDFIAFNAYPGWHQNSSLRGMPRPLCQACGLFVV